MAVTINGTGPITGLTTIDSPTTINGLTIPTTSFGKVLQIVLATDATYRSTTSTSFVDAGLSVTIIPQKSTSKLLLIYSGSGLTVRSSNGNGQGRLGISDSSNNLLSGRQEIGIYTQTSGQLFSSPITCFAFIDAVSTSSQTFKTRYTAVNTGNEINLQNSECTSQLYAIEVSA